MHERDDAAVALTEQVVRYAVERLMMSPPPLDGPLGQAELDALVGRTVTEFGLGGTEVLRRFTEHLAPATISVDHPLYLSFIPAAPTVASILFDLVVSASSIYGGSWLEGAGAVHAENQALRWLADLAGLPEQAGGVFVSGGTAGNLSALIAARHHWRASRGGSADRTRALVIGSGGAHSSILQATRAMDADLLASSADDRGRMTRDDLRTLVDRLEPPDRDRVVAVVATGGTTNAGIVDDLTAAADVAAELGAWFHVDGAYGAAALCAPSARDRFRGVERCDSLIVDPHKWLFAPFDSCALLYRDPERARAAHTQHAEYLDAVHVGESGEWNPSDYAHHLTRRARGLPFWFSLAVHGTAAYREAVEATLRLTRHTAEMIERAEHLELLVEPELSVVVFRRVGWDLADYQRWSDAELAAGRAFVVPTAWQGAPALRCCIVNPRTTGDQLRGLLDSLR
ncbi:MAG: pyridoxal phosphate-dependent decarboxylase family protein [Microthrixaceae bacterium]